jgi:membrane associated rhomboid family serine protease
VFPLCVSVPTRYASVVFLIAANVAVFFLQVSLPDDAQQAMVYTYGLVPARYTDPGWASRVGLEAGNYWPFLPTRSCTAAGCT